MFKKFLALTLIMFVMGGCTARWSTTQERTPGPQPTQASFRCTADGRPASPGTGWCTPSSRVPGATGYNQY